MVHLTTQEGVAQCCDKIWATLEQSKIKMGQYCQLVASG